MDRLFTEIEGDKLERSAPEDRPDVSKRIEEEEDAQEQFRGAHTPAAAIAEMHVEENDLYTCKGTAVVRNEIPSDSRSSATTNFRQCIVQLGIFDSGEGRVVSWGSGSVISAHGHILTAAHVFPAKYTAVLVGELEGEGKPTRWAYSCRICSEEEALKLEAADNSKVDLAVLQITATIEARPTVFDGSLESFDIIKEVEVDPSTLNTLYLPTSSADLEGDRNVRLFGFPKDRRGIRFKQVNATACGQSDGWVQVNATEVATSGFSGGPLLNDEGEIVAVLSFDYNDVKGHHKHLKSGTVNLSWFRRLSMIQPGHRMPLSEKELPANRRAVDAVSTQQALAAAQAKAAADQAQAETRLEGLEQYVGEDKQRLEARTDALRKDKKKTVRQKREEAVNMGVPVAMAATLFPEGNSGSFTSERLTSEGVSTAEPQKQVQSNAETRLREREQQERNQQALHAAQQAKVAADESRFKKLEQYVDEDKQRLEARLKKLEAKTRKERTKRKVEREKRKAGVKQSRAAMVGEMKEVGVGEAAATVAAKRAIKSVSTSEPSTTIGDSALSSISAMTSTMSDESTIREEQREARAEQSDWVEEKQAKEKEHGLPPPLPPPPQQQQRRNLELRQGVTVDGVLGYHVCDDKEQDQELKGGQGLVKKAYANSDDNDKRTYYALKQPLDPRRLRGHAREAQVYFNLNPDEHPHLAVLADVARHEGTPLLVMEWADSDLRRWLQKQRFEPASVLINGLKNKAEWNGSKARVHAYDQPSGRYQVRVDGQNGGGARLRRANVRLLTGTLVVIEGLVKAAVWNGCTGRVGGFDDAHGRYKIAVKNSGGDQKSLKIKPENILIAGLARVHIATDRVGKAIQLARGLGGLHEEKLVHQDLKTGNVLLYKQVLKIADFGLSCSAGDGGDGSDGAAASGLGRVDAVVGGTVGWMAPEQMVQRAQWRRLRAEERSKPEPACDVWAFGLLLALMLSEETAATVGEFQRWVRCRGEGGQLDFRDEEGVMAVAKGMGNKAEELIVQAAEAIVAAAGDGGGGANTWRIVAELLRRCLAQEPSQRPGARECVGELQRVYEALAGKRYPSSDGLVKAGWRFDLFSKFKPREREARYYRLVADDAVREAELLSEQLEEELRGSLGLIQWDTKAMAEALEAGTSAAEVLRANPTWLPEAGAALARHRQNKLLPVLVDWASATGRALAANAEGQGQAQEREQAQLAATLVVQVQAVWAGTSGLSMDGASRKCCSHGLGSTGDIHSPFSRMCEDGAAEVVRWVLAAAAAEREAGARQERSAGLAALMEPNPENGSTPLYRASSNGHVEVVSLLLKHKGIDANRARKARTGNGSTPLLIASHKGHAEVVSLLLEHKGIDANLARTDIGATPLYRASQNGHVEVVSLLLKHKGIDANRARTDDGSTPLFIASQQGHVEVVSLLLKHKGIDVNPAMTGNGSTPLYRASETGHAEVVSLLLKHKGIDANQATTDTGATPLFIASWHGHADVVSLLLGAGADTTAEAVHPSGQRFTARVVAEGRGHSAVVALLTEAERPR